MASNSLLVELPGPSSQIHPPPSPKDLLIASHDVLVLIFKLFTPCVSGIDNPENQLAKDGRKQLLRLALTCKAFLNPALDCLWSHLESLGPLFKLHPGLKTVGNSYFFRGGIDAQRSTRYHDYARKVRTVHFRDRDPSSSDYRISFPGYTWLGQQLQDSPLLPGLRSIHFAECPANSIHLGLLPLMLSPSVHRVEFGNSFLSTPDFHSYALPLVCDGLPSLTDLTLHDGGSSSQIGHAWKTLGDMSTRLQSLTLRFPNASTLQPATLRKLARELGNLTSLTLDAHTPSHGASEDISTRVFPSLHTLHLINRSGTALCPCYPSFLLEKATFVTFSLTGNVANENAFSQSLDTLSTLESLRGVHIEGPSNQWVTVPSVRLFLQRLQLEEFHLHKTRAFLQNTPADENQIVQRLTDTPAISTIQHLALPIWRQHNYGSSPSYPPMGCLLDVAQSIQGLRHFSLSIDSSRLRSNEETITSMVQNWTRPGGSSELRYLEIAEMRSRGFTPSEYRNIAHFLDLIFPNLISVTMIKHPNLSTQWNEHWQLIEEHRQMLKSLRLYRGNRW